MSSLKLSEKIHFGKCTGKRPIDLIKSKSEVDIRYLLWLREQKKGKFPAHSFDSDLHHTLDALIRSNSDLYGEYEQRYTVAQYDLWRAEKRIEIIKAKDKKKLDEIRKAEERKAKADAYNKRIAAEKEKALERERERRLKAEIKIAENQQRAELYGVVWGAW